MKIIFSRKGFDSSNGGFPSPILPDGSLCTLPIPSDDQLAFKDVSFNGENLGDIVSSLTRGRIQPAHHTHLDPDLRFDAVPRSAGWLPAFGQVDQAQAHLENQGVGLGDLFLFFGWFRQTESTSSGLVYLRGSKNIHVLYGWLQVGEIYKPTKAPGKVPAWASSHPHVQGAKKRAGNNTLYVATRRLSIGGENLSLEGGGIFPKYKPELCLTAKDMTRSLWQLPKWFYPNFALNNERPPLSYHTKPIKWSPQDSSVHLKTVGRGQEFVLDCEFYPEAIKWLRGIFSTE
jgi:hypothetical protein